MKAEYELISYSIENIVNIIFNERYQNIFLKKFIYEIILILHN